MLTVNYTLASVEIDEDMSADEVLFSALVDACKAYSDRAFSSNDEQMLESLADAVSDIKAETEDKLFDPSDDLHVDIENNKAIVAAVFYFGTARSNSDESLFRRAMVSALWVYDPDTDSTLQAIAENLECMR